MQASDTAGESHLKPSFPSSVWERLSSKLCFATHAEQLSIPRLNSTSLRGVGIPRATALLNLGDQRRWIRGRSGASGI